MRLIDADAKIMAQLYDDEHEDWVQKEMTVADYLSFSDTAISFVNSVPVVRCADCEHSDWYTTVDGRRLCYCMETGVGGRTEADFCSRGEREEGGT